jgi:Putative zinc-finger
MNCTHVKRLIPLYVGGDLNTQQVAGVRKHIETCERCRGLVAEFEESQGWLHDFTAPQFDEAVFENLRDAIREEIARVESRPSLFDLLTPIWNLRSAIAASLALALLTAGLLLYTDRSKSPDKPLTTNKAPISGPASGEQQNHEETVNTGPASQIRRQRSTATHRSRRGSTLSRDNTKVVANLPVLRVIALNNRFIERHLDIGETTFPSHSDTATNDDATQDADREMLRIEIQTADPNIRIIWIAPKNPTFSPAN